MRINVAEMKFLRFACGHTRLDKIENNEKRNRMNITEIHRKMQEEGL
jgi:hypothetical protein